MCLQSNENNTNVEELRQFFEWLLCVGDGKLAEPNDGYAHIEIPDEFLVTNFSDPIHGIVQTTYPNFVEQYNNDEFLKSRTILTSNIDIVEQINYYILSVTPGDEREHLSLDSIDMPYIVESARLDAITPEFLNTLKTSGLPNHRIKLKSDSSIMLLRNLE